MLAVTLVPDSVPREMRLSDVPLPEPGSGELRVRIQLASVNFADLIARRREGPAEIPGLDACGVVDAVGQGVSADLVGRRVSVFCDSGGYAEYVVVPEELAWTLPDSVDWEQAAAFPTVGVTAWNLLRTTADVKPGETVFISGAAGGVGGACAQIARVLGAGRIIGAVGSEAKADAAREFGCDDVIVGDDVDELTTRLTELVAGSGLHVAVDGVGGSALIAASSALENFGRLVVYGRSSGSTGTIDPRQIHRKNQSVLGYTTRGTAKQRPLIVQNAGVAALTLIQRGLLRLRIDSRFALADAAAAHDRLASRQSVGKVLLEMPVS